MDAMITARVPVEVKRQGNKVLESLAVTPSQAINWLYDYLVANHSLPEFRSETQRRFEGSLRVLSPQTTTPRMQEKLDALEAISGLMADGEIDWGKDAGKSYREIIAEGRRADYREKGRL